MGISLRQIADAWTGFGATETAAELLARLAAMTKPNPQPYRDISDGEIKLWYMTTTPENKVVVDGIYAAAKAGGNLPAEIAYDMLMDASGLSLSKAEVRAATIGMLGADAGASLIAGAANPDVPEFPGIELGQCENAIEWRQQGVL